ncbi:MAG: tetratricopeptide repeat protein [Lachnospiraceae bacterium]|nr:tetratricopeptide repeat protein [Candidatus Minthocola equi]
MNDFTPIPVGRIIEKLDSYLNINDYDAAERHLQYWLSEADVCGDMRGKLTVLNEQIGLYRKMGKEPECLQAISGALSLVASMNMEQTVTYGTTLINAATGYKAFEKAEEALPLYREAQIIYEQLLEPNDAKLGALYNNMASTLAGLGIYREAEDLYHKAIDVMKNQKYGALEVAITCLNIADLIASESGIEAGKEEIKTQLLKAEKLLNTEDLPRNGYYAFVCEKCAPVFGYYGYSLIEQELNRRAKEIYDRT